MGDSRHPTRRREPGSVTDDLVGVLTGLPRQAVEPVLRAADGFYMAFQGALKTLGLVADGGTPPEEATPAGRFARLPRREGRWPEARLRLPDSAVYWYAVESIFRRGALWRSSAWTAGA